jgi:hypothetical protein
MVRALSLAAVLSFALALAGCKDEHDTVGKKLLSKISELSSALESVKDEASSKAAATRIKSIGEDIKELKKKANTLPKLSEEQKKKLEAANKAQIDDVRAKFATQMMRLDENPKLMTTELESALEGVLKDMSSMQ